MYREDTQHVKVISSAVTQHCWPLHCAAIYSNHQLVYHWSHKQSYCLQQAATRQRQTSSYRKVLSSQCILVLVCLSLIACLHLYLPVYHPLILFLLWHVISLIITFILYNNPRSLLMISKFHMQRNGNLLIYTILTINSILTEFFNVSLQWIILLLLIM